MPLPEYRYGKVSGLLPDLTVVSERSESPMVCCGYCSAQMAALTARPGLSTLMKNEAHEMRDKGGRPHNHGNTASELRAGASKALGVTLQDVAIANIPARLRAGYAVTVGIQYGDLPAYLKVQTNDFGHAICLFGWQEANDRVGMFDPLWTQGARGAWVPWSTITKAMWPNKNHSTTVVRLSAGGGGSGSMAGIQFNPNRWVAHKIIDVFLDPSFSKKITTIQKGGKFTILGPKAVVDADGRDSSARAILVNTGGTIPGEGPAVRNILWVKGADMPTEQVPSNAAWDESIWQLLGNPEGRYPCPPPPVVTPPPTTSCDDQVIAAVMQRDTEWEEALQNGEPWPTATE